MSPTPEELALGEKAYRRVQFHEKYGARNLRQVPWLLAVCSGVFIVLSYHNKDYLLPTLFFIPISFLFNRAQCWNGRVHYANAKLILQLLKEKYGESLPWLVEERQLSAARDLAAEIAQDQTHRLETR